jgi:hypothetical protein
MSLLQATSDALGPGRLVTSEEVHASTTASPELEPGEHSIDSPGSQHLSPPLELES